MATLSSHVLSSVDGTHAAAVSVSIVRIAEDGGRDVIHKMKTDEGGRVKIDVPVAPSDVAATYELVFGIGAWFGAQALPRPGLQIVSDVVIRFSMPDPNGDYHIPIIVGPNGYSTWWSS